MPGVPSSLALAGVRTSEELVRALKAAADPPAGLSISKVELASLAWADSELHVPKKAHLLADWALEALCRAVRDSSLPAQGKGKARASSKPAAVLADAAVWQLLTDASGALSAAEHAALAQRHSTLALVSATARSSALHSLAVLRPASLALKRLIPAAAARAQHNIDLIAEPITAVIAALPSLLSEYAENGVDEDCLAPNIFVPLVRSWSAALEVGANGKKASKYCLGNVLAVAPAAWQALLRAEDTRPRAVMLLRASLRHFLAEALFTTERLAALLASATATDDVFAALRSAAADKADAASDIPALLPELLALLQGKLAQHRLALMPAAGPSADISLAAATAAQVAQERSAILHAFVEPAAELVESFAGARQASTRAALLEQIEQLKLFVRASDDAAAWKALLRRAGAAAAADIGRTAMSEAQSSSSGAALRTVTILLRLDDSLAKPLLPAVLRKVASSSRQDAAAQELLRTLADGAGARREVPELLALLCQALQAAPVQHADEALPALPVLRGALFSESLRAQLASALSIFIAPSQVMQCLVSPREHLSELVAALTASDGASGTASPASSKRRKTGSGAGKASLPAASLSSASLVLGLRMGALIVDNLLLPAPMREEIFGEMRQLFEAVLVPLLDRPRRPGHVADDAVLAGALHLRLAMLARATDVTIAAEQVSEDAVWLEAALDQRADYFVELLQQEPAPELLLALAATLLQRAQADSERRIVETHYTKMISSGEQPLVQALLSACEAASAQDDETWDGEVHGLSRGREGPAVWSSLAWDWLPTFERLAGSDVLELFCSSVIIPTLHPSSPASGLASISALLARNASFLESPRWRAALIKEGDRLAQGELTAESGGPLATQLALARFPIDYLPAAQQQTFAEYAATTDAQIARVARDLPLGSQSGSASGITQTHWAELRTWQARLVVATSAKSSGVPSRDLATRLLDLVDPTKLPARPEDDLQSATLRLFDAHVRALAHRALVAPVSATEAGPWSSLLHVDAQLASGLSTLGSTRSVQSAARVHLLELLLETAGTGSGAGKNKQVPSEVLVALAASSPCSASAAAEMLARIQSQLTSGGVAGLLDAAHELRTLAARLRLKQLATPEELESSQAVAVDVVRFLTRSVVLSPMLASLAQGLQNDERQPASQAAVELLRLFAVCLRLFKETGEQAQPSEDSLDAAMAPPSSTSDDLSARVALTFSALLTAFDDEVIADSLRAHFADCSAATTPASYDAALDAVTNALTEPTGVGRDELAALLDTAGVILRYGPEGTLAIAQRHWSRLIGELHPFVAEQPSVVLTALRTIEQVCSGKAMLLRSPDVGQLFALLGALLGAREQPESSSAAEQGPQIFSALVAILESVVRLRADLVSPLLPHLTALLSQLVALFPTLRAQIGAGHAAAVTSRMPAWLDIARAPLGPQEARALSRLLTSLNTKSVALPQSLQRKSKAAAAGERSAKVTSLAKALSKHAPYVLAAHVRTLVQPSTHVSITVRQELRAGLYALCDVTGTHERDALMLAHLDSGERAVLKSLWAEWEAQRYRGA